MWGHHVIIDEVPNAVSVIDSRLDDVSFKEFYLDRGYFSIEKDGLVLATPEGAKEELRLKNALDEALIKKIKSRYPDNSDSESVSPMLRALHHLVHDRIPRPRHLCHLRFSTVRRYHPAILYVPKSKAFLCHPFNKSFNFKSSSSSP